MAKKQQMLINYQPGEECRVALLEDGQLEEIHSERAGAVSYVGNVYVGKVTNVEPSIQAAFVDFGHDSNGFLHVSDIHPRYFPGGHDETTERIGHKTPRRERPPIQQCLKKGQEVIVQVLKEGINTKGPTLTSYISIPGRFLVMLPDMDRVGVSRKVEDDDLRRSMRKVLDSLELPDGFGFILRTAGEGKGKTDLKRDLAYLQRLWKDLEKRRAAGSKPRLLYAESDLLMRALRDFWTSDVNEIIVDNEAALTRAERFMRIVSPRSSTKLLHYDRRAPLFHAFGVEEQIARIHAREVPLKSGGSLVIDETEAMIAIDVNSGRMRKHGDAETTAYKTNVEAVDEICRQLRLRDVGGLVLCDLIDMIHRSNRRKIEQQFRDRLKKDRAASKILPISQFGIVEMTRQRQKQSVRSTHFAPCPECNGRGVLKRPDSVADDAVRELAALLEHDRVAKIEIVVSPRVAGALLSKKRQTLTRLELTLQKTVDVRVSEDITADRVSFYAYDENGADIDQEKLPTPSLPKNLREWKHKARAGDDWAVDTAREEHGLPEPELEEALEEEEAILIVDEVDDDQEESAASRDGESDDKPKKKRRRGRRGGRGRGKKRKPDSETPPETDESASAEDDTPKRAAQAPTSAESVDDRPLRGDSWDLEPADVTPRLAEESPDAQVDAASNGAAPPPKTRSSKKRSSRKRGRKKTASKPDAATEADEVKAEAPSTDTEPTSKKKRSRSSKKSGARKKTPGAKKKTAKKPSSSKKSRSSKKKAPAKAQSTSEPKPGPATGSDDGAGAKPKRRLYGSRRKLKPGQAATASRDE